MVRRSFLVVLFVGLCISAGGIGNRLAIADVLPNQVCQALSCTGTVLGTQTGGTQQVSCVLNAGNPGTCVANPPQNCTTIGDPSSQNKCTGSQQGNPMVNCFVLYQNCSHS